MAEGKGFFGRFRGGHPPDKEAPPAADLPAPEAPSAAPRQAGSRS